MNSIVEAARSITNIVLLAVCLCGTWFFAAGNGHTLIPAGLWFVPAMICAGFAFWRLCIVIYDWSSR